MFSCFLAEHSPHQGLVHVFYEFNKVPIGGVKGQEDVHAAVAVDSGDVGHLLCERAGDAIALIIPGGHQFVVR